MASRSTTPGPSRKQIRKAASAIRKWWTDPSPNVEVTEEVALAWILVRDFRASIQKPLDKVTIQLRRFVGYEAADVIVAQRLKRMRTILDKLGREPTMDVTRMQDIGGCRAVLPGAPEVQAVLGRIETHWRCEKVYDYVTNPKPTGYRAVHAVVTRDERLVEIQLRTPGQQQWAVAVERAGARLRLNVKDGEGPAEVLRFFNLLSGAIALEEAGEPADDELVAELDALSEQVRGLMTRSG